MLKVIDNKKLLQDVHTKNQTVREKVELEVSIKKRRGRGVQRKHYSNS